MTEKEINHYIHRHIPATEYMQIHVDHWHAGKIQLSAPLAPNINHAGTGFGGSVSSLAVMSAWAALFARLNELGIKNELVIWKTNYEFIKPITGTFSATCALPEGQDWQDFIDHLDKKGRGRITLQAKVFCQGLLCGQYEGIYVSTLCQ